MKIRKNLLLTACPLALVLSLLAGCNTVHGVGQDVRATGHAISQAAEDDRDY